MRSLLVFLLVQILTNALRQTSCVTPMQTASIPRVLFIALVQLVLLETASTARVRTRNDQSIIKGRLLMHGYTLLNCIQVYCICTAYAYSLRIRGSQHRLRLFLIQPLPWNHFLYTPPPPQLSVSFNVQVGERLLVSSFAPPLPPEGGTWVNSCWVRAAGLSEPLPH